MVRRNPDFFNLQANYLFAEIAQHRKALLERQPDAKLISLGIGDTTEPIPEAVVRGLTEASEALGTREGYTGYESGYGRPDLRAAIADKFYQGRVHPDEIFISDGSKPDIGRLQMLLGKDCTIAVQDPSYPAYIAGSVLAGKSGKASPETGQYERLVYMPCTPENDFFPDLDSTPPADLIFFCSPNNPTGTVPTRDQLTRLVQFARDNKSLLVFDSAYAGFIRDSKLLKTIFEIPGADSVAMETGSFSKLVGFTGVRLGWTVVPKALQFEDGSSVHADWSQIQSTFFNGACNLAQAGGMAAMSEEGLVAAGELTDFYLENAGLLRDVLEEKGYQCYGGVHTPYIWARVPGKPSWEIFHELLNEVHLVTTPGVGFGPAGEGFVRFSAFGHREDVHEAVRRLQEYL